MQFDAYYPIRSQYGFLDRYWLNIFINYANKLSKNSHDTIGSVMWRSLYHVCNWLHWFISNEYEQHLLYSIYLVCWHYYFAIYWMAYWYTKWIWKQVVDYVLGIKFCYHIEMLHSIRFGLPCYTISILFQMHINIKHTMEFCCVFSLVRAKNMLNYFAFLTTYHIIHILKSIYRICFTEPSFNCQDCWFPRLFGYLFEPSTKLYQTND